MGRSYYPVAIEHVRPEKFWRWVDRRADTDCWLWTRRGGTGGGAKYGLFDMQVPTPWGSATLRQSAHRIAYVLAKGHIPAGLEIMHSCDTPRCVNPAHLRPGTAKDNARDKVRKGRHPRGASVRGGGGRTRRAWHHLSEDEVTEIRSLYASRSVKLRDLCQRFGLSLGAISALVHGKSWMRIGGPIVEGDLRRGGKSDLTATDIAEIRRLRAEAGESIRQLSLRYGVSRPAIRAIIMRRTWRHVP